ncbi:MAG: hypothetical protein C0504_09795 [Candidatus Solibacter sp.]|nr:hypothetical protein [Candidatus Solibacter sp.]
MSEIKDLLERFRRGAELVAVVSTGSAGAEWDFVSAPGKWSLRQIVCHLADSEMIGRYRLASVIAEDNPTLMWYDQDAWAANLDYSKRKFSQALETFRRVRGENHELLKDLPEETFLRTATHSKNGVMSLKDLLLMYAEHAEGHARQIRAAREVYKAARAARKS